ncbi:MAG: IS1 family transposase [Euryarchaeota archaeon]|nr:IS1 family transposase [Euryarchaeota archaeon]
MSGDLVLELFILNEEKASNVFRYIRWVGGVYCPGCELFDVYKRGFSDERKITRRYSCNNCGKNFTDFTGTIFANKNLPLGEMSYIIAN